MGNVCCNGSVAKWAVSGEVKCSRGSTTNTNPLLRMNNSTIHAWLATKTHLKQSAETLAKTFETDSNVQQPSFTDEVNHRLPICLIKFQVIQFQVLLQTVQYMNMSSSLPQDDGEPVSSEVSQFEWLWYIGEVAQLHVLQALIKSCQTCSLYSVQYNWQNHVSLLYIFTIKHIHSNKWWVRYTVVLR